MVLLTLGSVSVSRAHAMTAATQAPSADPADPVQDSDYWLGEAEAREGRGDYAGAGKAQVEAFHNLDKESRGGEIGARIALDAAELLWSAFAVDGDLVHLRAAKVALDSWTGLAGEDSAAESAPRVRDEVSRIVEVVDTLESASTDVAAGNMESAQRQYTSVLGVLSGPGYPWAVGARVACTAAQDHVDSYDGDVDGVDERVAANRWKLERAKTFLEDWRDRQPGDEESTLGVEIDRMLATVGLRIEEAQRRLDALAAQRLSAQRAKEEQLRRQREEREEAARQAEEARQARKARQVSITVLTIGVVGTVGGAALLGGGISLAQGSERLIQTLEYEAVRTELEAGDTFDRESFESETQAFAQQLRVRNGLLLGGAAVLLAGGVATYGVGSTRLSRARRGSDTSPVSSQRRPLHIALVATGAVATVAGAGLVGDAIVVNTDARSRVEAEYTEALMLEQELGAGYDFSSFDEAVAQYESQVRVRATTEIVVGSVLLAGGVLTTVVGATGLVRSRKANPVDRRAWLVPSMSRSGLGLSLGARF